MGYDKHFSFAKMIKACSYAKNPCNHFIGTNEDTFLPIENKEIVVPGKLVKYNGNCLCLKTFSLITFLIIIRCNFISIVFISIMTYYLSAPI